MVTKHNLDCFDEFTARFIFAKARQLIGREGLKESDRPDLIQDFVVDLLERRKHFNPHEATWEAFVVVVCENRCAAILEHRRAEMRSAKREAGSLNRSATNCDAGPGDVGSNIADSQHGVRTGQRHRSHEETFDLINDVVSLLEQLPPQLRALFERLKQESISQVARDMGCSRKTIYRRIAQVRQRFERAGMREYL